MVGDQVFGRYTKVHRIPVPELISHLVKSFRWDGAVLRDGEALAKDKVKHIICKIFNLDLFRALRFIAIEIVLSLQVM
jgi:hypothetical protein